MNYTKIYNQIISKRQSNIISKKDKYCELHHIVPRALAGTNKKENKVMLTAKEHYICHHLLTKMYRRNSVNWHKMIKAFMRMHSSNRNQYRYFNASVYEKLRIDHAYSMSDAQTGRNNSQFGSRWMYNFQSQKCQNVKGKNIELFESTGWKYGRILDWNKRICPMCDNEKQSHCKTCPSCKQPQKRSANTAGCKKGGRNRASTTREDVISALHKCRSLKHCLEILGYKSAGNSFNRIKKIAEEENILVQ